MLLPGTYGRGYPSRTSQVLNLAKDLNHLFFGQGYIRWSGYIVALP